MYVKSNFCRLCFLITPPPEYSFKFDWDWSGSFLTFHSSFSIEFWLNLIFWHNLKQIISYVIISYLCTLLVPSWFFIFWKTELIIVQLILLVLYSAVIENGLVWKFFLKKSKNVHLRKRPRKSQKMDFQCRTPTKLVRVWYHFEALQSELFRFKIHSLVQKS